MIKKLQKLTEGRRSIYSLSKVDNLDRDALIQSIEHALTHTPTSFNSQSFRIVVLLNKEHEKFWENTESILRKKSTKDFTSTKIKMDMFKNSEGTILFYEDTAVIADLSDKMPKYAKELYDWVKQDNAMLQYNVWLSLNALGLGANLQHYNPIVDNYVSDQYNLDENWLMIGQMVFGKVNEELKEKIFVPIERKIKVFG